MLVNSHHINLHGIRHSLFLDENRGKFQHLKTLDDKIKYIRTRVQLVLFGPCRAVLKEATTNYLGLVVATAICAGISAAGSFMYGDLPKWRGKPVRDADRFKGFVKKYMQGPRGQMSKVAWADWLYKSVRCGLAHGFTIEEGGIEIALNEYVRQRRDGPQMNPMRLLDDLDLAWLADLDDVRNEGPQSALGRRFLERFDAIYKD